jgi:hypothetical protein
MIRMRLSTVRGRTVDGAKFLGTLLQLGAPKCAICWTSFAGLWNAGWFVARTTNPWWLFFACMTAAVSLGAGFISAWRRRRYAAFALAAGAWLLLACSWLLGATFTRYAGVAFLMTSIAIDRRPMRFW